MAPDRSGNFDTLVLAKIVRRSHVIHVTALQHEVHQAFGCRDHTKGDRVMARIAVHESQAYRIAAATRPHLDEVAYPESQQVAVKAQSLRRIVHAQHDM